MKLIHRHNHSSLMLIVGQLLADPLGLAPTLVAANLPKGFTRVEISVDGVKRELLVDGTLSQDEDDAGGVHISRAGRQHGLRAFGQGLGNAKAQARHAHRW